MIFINRYCNTKLELASALYSGTTKAKDGSYHADENVKKFVEVLFPEVWSKNTSYFVGWNKEW